MISIKSSTFNDVSFTVISTSLRNTIYGSESCEYEFLNKKH